MCNKSKLTVIYTVKFSDDEMSGPCIGFYKWLPEGENYKLVKVENDLTITLTVNKKCVAQLSEVTNETIQKNSVNRIYMFFAEVDFGYIDEKLASFIYDERDSGFGKHFGIQPTDERYTQLSLDYNRLGKIALESVLKTSNRLISFARNIKGQYWLNAIVPSKDNLANLNNSWNAKAIINDKKFRWFPSDTNRLHFDVILDHSTAIHLEEWNEVNSFVCSESRPNIIFELLANSKYLINQGHRRSSIIESVTALEVAVSEFTKKPKIDVMKMAEYKSRIDTSNIGNQSKHLGFTGSLRYLIPLLFHSDELDDEILKKCFQAIEIRNNVVHKGQRDVSKDLVKEVENAISHCCKILDRYTEKTPNKTHQH